MTYDVFISYSRKDTAIADRVCAALDAAGISYFIDRQGIAGGMEFPQILADAIENSRLFLFLASENSYKSKYTKNEVTFAFNEKSHNSLLPYIIDGSRMPSLLRFTFANINVRTMHEHPIDPVLVDDVLKLLGRTRKSANPTPRSYTQQELEEMDRKGDEYYDAKRYDQAAECYKIVAANGWMGTQNRLGYMYANGQGVPQDYGEAVRWYRKAAEQGNGDAQYNLGYMHHNGWGVPQDYGEAVRWWRKAAEQGNGDAQYNLGVMYANGRGVPQDYGEAVRWYRKAVEQGHARAQGNLGVMYYNGQGVPQDYGEAVRWCRKAAEQGNGDAQYNLAIMYKYGQGVNKDLSEARRWFQKAADQGDENAKEELRKL